MANCLVTGGAGFIGSHIAELLLSNDHSVTVLDLPGGKKAPGGARFIRGDIADKKSVQEAISGADFVFHQAAIVSVAFSMKEPEKTRLVNVEGTKNVLECALRSGVKKVMLASSAAVYGDSPPPLKETSLLRPLSPYGESKLECEKLAQSFQNKGLRTVSLRYFNVYGPHQDPSSPYSGVIAKFIDLALMGKPPTIFGDGLQTRDFVYVKDVAKANLLAMEKADACGEFNIASGKSVTVSGLYGQIKKLAKSKADPFFTPEREGDIRYSYADISKAGKTLGFRPEFSLEEGLKETMAWAKSIS
jgi:UDP-glucose 4-epimerase